MRKAPKGRLLNVFIELYNRSQQPILTKDLFKGVEHISIYEDKGAGKDYPLETYLSTGVLRVDKVWSKGKLEVVWNTRYPDLEMVENLWRYRKNELLEAEANKLLMNLNDGVDPELLKPIKSQEPTKDLVAEKIEEVKTGPEEIILSIDEICERFDVEFKNYHPNTKTIPKVIKMLNVMDYKAGERWCHKDNLFCLDGENEEGKLNSVNHRATSQFLRKRLVAFDVLKRNPDNNSEYLYVAEYEDIKTYARRLAFAINYLSDKGALEQKKAERLLLASIEKELIKKEEEKRIVEEKEKVFIEAIEAEIDRDIPIKEEVPTFGFNDDLLEALHKHTVELRKNTESNIVLTTELREGKADNEAVRKELKEMHEVNHLISDDLSEKLVDMHQATVKLTEAVKVNNLISDK